MKKRILTFSFVLLSLTVSGFAQDQGFKSLFNGKDLSGWDGNPQILVCERWTGHRANDG